MDLISVLANVVMRIPTIFCIVPTAVPRRNVDHQNTATSVKYKTSGFLKNTTIEVGIFNQKM